MKYKRCSVEILSFSLGIYAVSSLQLFLQVSTRLKEEDKGCVRVREGGRGCLHGQTPNGDWRQAGGRKKGNT